jgi:hypothetical protein
MRPLPVRRRERLTRKIARERPPSEFLRVGCATTEDHYAEVNRMLQESNLSRNSSYLVPCVLKAVHMIQALRETGAGLRVEDLRKMTGYSRTTIYRILRTLAACGYIFRNSGGVYRLNYQVITAPGRGAANRQDGGRFATHIKPENGQVAEFERWGVRFRGDGARMGTHSLGAEPVVMQSGEACGGSCET